MGMDEKTISGLRDVARQVRSILADARGSVTIHLAGGDEREPQVEVRLCDLTREQTDTHKRRL